MLTLLLTAFGLFTAASLFGASTTFKVVLLTPFAIAAASLFRGKALTKRLKAERAKNPQPAQEAEVPEVRAAKPKGHAGKPDAKTGSPAASVGMAIAGAAAVQAIPLVAANEAFAEASNTQMFEHPSTQEGFATATAVSEQVPIATESPQLALFQETTTPRNSTGPSQGAVEFAVPDIVQDSSPFRPVSDADELNAILDAVSFHQDASAGFDSYGGDFGFAA